MESLYTFDTEFEKFDDMFLAFVDLITTHADWEKIIDLIFENNENKEIVIIKSIHTTRDRMNDDKHDPNKEKIKLLGKITKGEKFTKRTNEIKKVLKKFYPSIII